MKNLLLFTAQFPFGNGETFIENELPFLVEAFEQVIIIAADTTSPQTRTLPSKVKVIRRPLSAGLKHKLASLLRFFSKDISNEIHFVKQTLRPRPYAQILSAIIGSYAQGLAITQFIKNLIASNKLEPASTLLYSYWMDNTALGLALFKKQNPDIKAICRAHGWDVYFERHQPAYLPFRNLIATQLDYCCCISENGRQYLLNKLGLAFKNKIRLARLGTINNTNHISAANTGKLVIVSCSAIIPLKRIHLIIESLALLNDINVEWVHFGAGPLEKTIKELAAQRLNTGKITYAFAGHVSNARVLEYYTNNNVDLLINLSETEGLPVSFMEALSFGIPVLATDVGGVSEIIKDGINGFLVPVNASAELIAGAIRNVFNMAHSNREALVANAQAEWQTNFNAAGNYKKFVELIN